MHICALYIANKTDFHFIRNASDTLVKAASIGVAERGGTDVLQ